MPGHSHAPAKDRSSPRRRDRVMAGALALAAPPWWEPRRWAKRVWRAAQRFWRLRVTRRYKVRAGGVVVRGDEVLLISSRKTPGAWILPAGTAERGETLRETALREVREEAGVACVVARDLGAFADDAKLVRTTFYVMRVATSCAEWEDRDRGRLRRWWRARDASPRLKARDREALAAYLACLEDDDDTRRLGGDDLITSLFTLVGLIAAPGGGGKDRRLQTKSSSRSPGSTPEQARSKGTKSRNEHQGGQAYCAWRLKQRHCEMDQVQR